MIDQDAYERFLRDKANVGSESGFEPTFMPAELFDFQQAMVDYAVRKGCAALFEDCGLGKTVQFLTWAQVKLLKPLNDTYPAPSVPATVGNIM